MRFTFRGALVALVAMCAVGAVASASASAALPEFVPGEGEKLPIALNQKSNGTTPAFIENTAGMRIIPECKGFGAKGEVTGAKTLSLSLEMEHCSEGGRGECTSEGAAKGHVVLPGTGTLVYINKATKQVGLVLTVPKVTVTGCGTIWVRGGLVIPVTPVNTKTSTLSSLVKGEKGKQQYTKYENEKGEMKHAWLETNFGGGYLESDLEVGEEIRLATSKPVTVSA